MTTGSTMGFFLAMTLLAASPGPGVFAAVSRSLSTGFRSSIFMILGIVLGDLIFLVFAIFGLSTIALLLGRLFFLLKIAGGLYLIWLGWYTWNRKPEKGEPAANGGIRSDWNSFLGGLLVTLGNPKVILFYMGFLPTFFNLETLTLVDGVVIVAIVCFVLMFVLGWYCFSASRTRRLFSGHKAMTRIQRGAGAVMIVAGVAVIF